MFYESLQAFRLLLLHNSVVMKTTRRGRKDVVASVSPETSLIEEKKDNNSLSLPLKSTRKVAIVGRNNEDNENCDDDNENVSSSKENKEECKSKPSTPVKNSKNIPTVTPNKADEQKPNKSPKKGPFGRKITEEDYVVSKPAVDIPALVKIVYRCQFCNSILYAENRTSIRCILTLNYLLQAKSASVLVRWEVMVQRELYMASSPCTVCKKLSTIWLRTAN